MARLVYRSHVISAPHASANGILVADQVIQLRGGVSPNFTWTDVPSGHFDAVVQAMDVQAVLDSALTNAQKKSALMDLIKAYALNRGIDSSDEALNGWGILFPVESYPLDVNLK